MEDYQKLGLRPFSDIKRDSEWKGIYPRQSGRTILICYNAAITLRNPEVIVTIWGHTFEYTSELYNQVLSFATKLDLDTTRLRKTFCPHTKYDIQQWWRGKDESLWRVFVDHWRNGLLFEETQRKVNQTLGKTPSIIRMKTD